MCSGGLAGRPLSLGERLAGRPLSLDERLDALEREIRAARLELEELPARIAWLEKQHDALKVEAEHRTATETAEVQA